jgi:hypothetical protein
MTLIQWLHNLLDAAKPHHFSHRELEALKLDYLNRGIGRGKTSMRDDAIFDLYLQRADPTESDDGYERQAMLGTGVLSAAVPGEETYYWWCVIKPGQETCLGDAAKLSLRSAVQRYVDLLPDETIMRLAIGRRSEFQSDVVQRSSESAKGGASDAAL